MKWINSTVMERVWPDVRVSFKVEFPHGLSLNARWCCHKLLANGSTALKWKLCHHRLKCVWQLDITLKRRIPRLAPLSIPGGHTKHINMDRASGHMQMYWLFKHFGAVIQRIWCKFMIDFQKYCWKRICKFLPVARPEVLMITSQFSHRYHVVWFRICSLRT